MSVLHARLTREVRAGPLSLEISAGDIRGIRLGGTEVIQRIFVAVRDEAWGTAPNRVTDLTLRAAADRFSAAFTVESRSERVDFTWSARIEGSSEGRLSISFDGRARRGFRRNRLGFCILHPASSAGSACRWESVDGSRGAGFLPIDVAPHQPFMGLRSFSHEVAPGTWARLDFEGDIFEMEDQRNWSDGSFKIYCTPLALPFPVQLKAGDRIEQRVMLSLEGASPLMEQPPTPRMRPWRVPPVVVEPGAPTGRQLCRIGFGMGADPLPSDGLRALLDGLAPDHLRVDCDLDVEPWQEVLPARLGVVRSLAAAGLGVTSRLQHTRCRRSFQLSSRVLASPLQRSWPAVIRRHGTRPRSLPGLPGSDLQAAA
jgi:hypothetical protein